MKKINVKSLVFNIFSCLVSASVLVALSIFGKDIVSYISEVFVNEGWFYDEALTNQIGIVFDEPSLVYSIAARFSGRGADMSDLVESGTIGLVKAIKTFDFSHGCVFSTYAVPLIFGEIRRFLRDDGIIKVSREEKRLSALLLAERERRLSAGEDADIRSVAVLW